MECTQGSDAISFLVILAAVWRVDWGGAAWKQEAVPVVQVREIVGVWAGERPYSEDRKTEQRIPVLYFPGIFNQISTALIYR